ncbi:hypothetical protein [Qingrenia yutianensis]|uniref:Uncharacterized protein n=1 Tax=Qingrenia yutianensis TaxID=2763676 RepID=A0A926IMK6_9FIRM|nr:hypothetical protein [Qingrenia yutianensis]MBC8596142.1 hypothetical protein [Qingrenia yutianensis]
MKKLLTAVLVLSMLLGLCFVPSVSAATLKEITLFETDFENDTVGEAPAALAPYGNAIADNATVYAEADGNKYADTLGKGARKRFRMLFNEAVSSGTVVAEFDLNTTGGAVALGMVYKSKPTEYLKWPFYVTNGIKDYAVKGFTATGGNPPGTEVTGKTVTFTKDGSSDNLTFKVNQWQHYKVIFDFDNQTVTAYIDNEKSNTIGGYEYFGKTNDAIAGLAFYCSEPDAETYKPSNKFDNIKVYTGYGNYLIDKDYEDGNVGTGNASNVKVIDSPEALNINSKILSFEQTGAKARYPLSRALKNETFYIEFDVRAGHGGLGVALLSKTDPTTSYSKYIFSSGTLASNPKLGLKAYTEYGSGMSTHPSGNAGSQTYIKGYRASGATTDMKLTAGETAWNHVKIEVDLANARIRVTLDGVVSDYIEGFTYLKDVDVAHICFHCSNKLSTTEEAQKNYIDNLKVYTIADKVYNVGIKDFTPSAYTAGTKIEVNYDFTVTDLSSKDVELIVASYNGGELCEVNIEKIENVNTSGTKKASLTLTKDCDEIRAFAWENGTLVPLAEHVSKTNNK